MNNTKRQAIFKIFQQQDPHPKTELKYSSNFELLVAVILSAQATDISVNKATQKLFEVANTPKKILKLNIRELKKYIKTIGLYNTKASHIIAACKILEGQYGGEVPCDRSALESLPGVGRKTANVILNTAFGIPTIAVDTHIFRVANRTKIAPGHNVTKVEEKLLRMVPDIYKKDAHHWLILHGRYTCMARKPLCSNCKIYAYCEWGQKKNYL